MNPLPERVRFIERDWLSSNQVLMVDGERATLVDTGYAKHAPLTVELVRSAMAQAGATRLERIVNTHLHSDHCGGNRALAEAFGCAIDIPAASWDDVARWDREALTHEATGQRCERFVASGTVSPGDVLEMGGLRWTAHASPGHDPKSLIFHCAQEGLLISADVLWETGFGVIFPELEGESGFAEQAAMLDLIAGLDVRWVMPGHGPAFGDVRGALARARSRLEALRSDPARNARHALKVLVKFLLLDLERIESDRLIEPVRNARVMHSAAAQIGLEYEDALRWAADELVAQGALRREGGWLLNA